MARESAVMNEAEATERVHLFNSAVYFTPFLGALLADVFVGKYRTIIWLSLVYCLGHAALACMGVFGNSPWWLMAGLGLIALGSGGIKPCVSAHVGDQFGARNGHLLSRTVQLVLFRHQYGGVHLGIAHAVAARVVWPAFGVRRAGSADGDRHAGILVGPAPIHPRAGGWDEIRERGFRRRRDTGDAETAAIISVCGDVLGAVRPDGIDVDFPVARHGPAFPGRRMAALADPIAQLDFRADLHPGFRLSGLSAGRPDVETHAAAQDRARVVHHGGGVRAGGPDPAMDRRRGEAEHQLADPRLRAADGGGGDGFHRRAGICLHAGSENDEIAADVLLSRRGGGSGTSSSRG